jgi:hypothetical protein
MPYKEHIILVLVKSPAIEISNFVAQDKANTGIRKQLPLQVVAVTFEEDQSKPRLPPSSNPIAPLFHAGALTFSPTFLGFG